MRKTYPKFLWMLILFSWFPEHPSSHWCLTWLWDLWVRPDIQASFYAARRWQKANSQVLWTTQESQFHVMFWLIQDWSTEGRGVYTRPVMKLAKSIRVVSGLLLCWVGSGQQFIMSTNCFIIVHLVFISYNTLLWEHLQFSHPSLTTRLFQSSFPDALRPRQGTLEEICLHVWLKPDNTVKVSLRISRLW